MKAAREHKKCVQHGTQRRSSSQVKAAVQALRDGVIGREAEANALLTRPYRAGYELPYHG